MEEFNWATDLMPGDKIRLTKEMQSYWADGKRRHGDSILEITRIIENYQNKLYPLYIYFKGSVPSGGYVYVNYDGKWNGIQMFELIELAKDK
jgi:hypothetical protein